MEVVAGVDLGGTAINYTLVNREEQFLIEGLCEHPALSKQGPEVCLEQIATGLKIATDRAAIALDDVVAIGLDTPGPSSAAGRLSARGSTNFVHPKWAGFDIREGLAAGDSDLEGVTEVVAIELFQKPFHKMGSFGWVREPGCGFACGQAFVVPRQRVP